LELRKNWKKDTKRNLEKRGRIERGQKVPEKREKNERKREKRSLAQTGTKEQNGRGPLIPKVNFGEKAWAVKLRGTWEGKKSVRGGSHRDQRDSEKKKKKGLL